MLWHAATKQKAMKAAGVEAVKGPPVPAELPRLKSVLCIEWSRTGRCSLGVRCLHAHGPSEPVGGIAADAPTPDSAVHTLFGDYVTAAREARAKGDLASAMDHFMGAFSMSASVVAAGITDDSSEGSLLVEMGEVHALSGQIEQARDCFTKAVERGGAAEAEARALRGLLRLDADSPAHKLTAEEMHANYQRVLLLEARSGAATADHPARVCGAGFKVSEESGGKIEGGSMGSGLPTSWDSSSRSCARGRSCGSSHPEAVSTGGSCGRLNPEPSSQAGSGRGARRASGRAGRSDARPGRIRLHGRGKSSTPPSAPRNPSGPRPIGPTRPATRPSRKPRVGKQLLAKQLVGKQLYPHADALQVDEVLATEDQDRVACHASPYRALFGPRVADALGSAPPAPHLCRERPRRSLFGSRFGNATGSAPPAPHRARPLLEGAGHSHRSDEVRLLALRPRVAVVE